MTAPSPPRALPSRWTEPAARITVGGLFAWAALLKLADPAAFTADILSFQLLPYTAAAALALALPWLELAAGVAVVLRRAGYAGGLAVLTLLMAVFTAAIAVSWARGLDITCGCFGRGEGNQTDYPSKLALNAALLAVIGYLDLRLWGPAWVRGAGAGPGFPAGGDPVDVNDETARSTP